MTRLTVAEKTHWKDRITGKLNQRIAALFATRPGFQGEIARQARQLALESLGLAETQRALDELEVQQQKLNQRRQHLHRTLLAELRGVPLEELDPALTPTRCQQDALQAVNRRQQVHERELLAGSEVGREILRLEQEREGLLDVVWLAHSSSQIRQLWKQVSEVLGEKLSPLQQQAVQIPAQE